MKDNYVPPTGRVGEYIVFGADPIGVSVGVCIRFFVFLHYLLNQLMDFDQTCIDTLFGGGEELIRFWLLCLDLIFRGTLKCPRYSFRAISSELEDGF